MGDDFTMVKVRIEVKREFRLGEKGEQFKEELLNLVAEEGVLHMESVTPKRTGRGAYSYRVINRGGNTREINNSTFYLPYVNDGTGIYGPRHARITPKNAKFLHFTWKGQEWFLRSVRGQKPRRFVERGANDIAKSVDKLAVIAARRVL